MRSNYKRLGDFIELVDIRNKGLKITNLVGLSISKQFIKSVANTIGTDMENYKIIHKNEFACSIMQVRRDKKMPLALYKDDEPAIISQAYPVFKIREDAELQPEYLMMWFSRSEFDRHACFMAVGGVRGSLEWEDFLDMELPIPSIEKQRAIVKEYNTVVNRIKLNEHFNQKLEETAQALYKHWFVDFEFPIHLSSSPPREEEYPQGEVVKKTQQEVKLHQVVKPQHQDANNTHQVVKKTHQEVKPHQVVKQQHQDETHPQQLNNLPYLKTFRKKLRNNLTPAEATLWNYLKGKQLENKKFRRQHSFGNYILDFYCPSESLAIELDGQGHFEAEQAEYDRERDLFLQYYGIKVLRFENKIVFDNMHGLLEDVKKEFGWKMNHPAFQAPLLKKEGSTLGVGYKSGGGKMVYNEELDKEIPEGFEVGLIGDLFTFQRGHDLPSQNRIKGEYPVFASSGISEFHNEFKIDKPTLITGRSGSLGQLFYYDKACWPLNTTLYIVEFKKATPFYSLYFLQTVGLKELGAGSAVPTLNRNDLHSIPKEIPNMKVLELFDTKVEILQARIESYVNQNEKLEELNNLLLSKMSKVESESYQIEKEMFN